MCECVCEGVVCMYVCEGVMCMYMYMCVRGWCVCMCVYMCVRGWCGGIHEAPIPDWYPEQVNLCL